MKTRWFNPKYVMVSPNAILARCAATDELEQELNNLLASGATCIMVNLAEVPHLNHHGLWVLRQAERKARPLSKRVVLVGATVQTHNIFMLFALQATFNRLFDSVQEVVDYFEAPMRA